MRMWMLPPRFLCRQHLLGEHSELHKHRPTFEKQHSISGRITPKVTSEPESMASRHDELVREMLRRGYNHNSPFEQPDLSYLPDYERDAKVNQAESLKDLVSRCPACRERIIQEIDK